MNEQKLSKLVINNALSFLIILIAASIMVLIVFTFSEPANELIDAIQNYDRNYQSQAENHVNKAVELEQLNEIRTEVVLRNLGKWLKYGVLWTFSWVFFKSAEQKLVALINADFEKTLWSNLKTPLLILVAVLFVLYRFIF